jgi:hypothetical protein
MKPIRWIQALFGLAALYDAVLGIVFLVAGPWVYDKFQITYPNHWGYIHFPAALLIVFALMFLAIACNPQRNRNLIPYGIGLKVAYCAVTIGHWAATDLPGMWKPFVIIDLVMAVLFVWAWVAIGSTRRAPAEA